MTELEGADGSLHPSISEQALALEQAFDANNPDELESACLRALAIVWADPAKLELLRSDPRHFLRQFCDYELPRTIHLLIRDVPEGHSAERHPRDLVARRDASRLSKAEFTLYIPPRPALAEQAVALAELSGPSGALAFTC
ncbi:hypothetical protein [Sorangium cellulosum]|uniref:hypothetical protein n=1 Tax=Sorangium cellulosum TaxID=56 RepID=UPI000CF4F21B|nr:hypothetical protein [Sorangium cellulosum]